MNNTGSQDCRKEHIGITQLRRPSPPSVFRPKRRSQRDGSHHIRSDRGAGFKKDGFGKKTGPNRYQEGVRPIHESPIVRDPLLTHHVAPTGLAMRAQAAPQGPHTSPSSSTRPGSTSLPSITIACSRRRGGSSAPVPSPARQISTARSSGNSNQPSRAPLAL